MAGRSAVSLPGGQGRGAIALGAILLLALLAAPVAHACSGPGIPFERVVAHPGTIGLMRVLDTAGNPDAPDRYRFAVDEVWRGVLPPVLEIEAPVVHACGDQLAVGIGDRLVLALEVNAFDDAKPMAAFWLVNAAGRIDGTLVEERPGVATLAALREILAPAGAVRSDDPSGGQESGADGVPLVVALLVIASGVLGGAVLIAALARRRQRDERR
jgi:hypothetical protein